MQDALAAALAGLEGYGGRASERNWLMGILKHKIVDSLRRQYREQPATDLALEEESGGTMTDFFDRLHHWKRKPNVWRDPRSALEKKEFFEVLDNCLGALPGRWAQVFRLRILEQFSLSEVSEVLNVTSSNLGVLLYRARLRIRECLQVNWFQNPKERKK